MENWGVSSGWKSTGAHFISGAFKPCHNLVDSQPRQGRGAGSASKPVCGAASIHPLLFSDFQKGSGSCAFILSIELLFASHRINRPPARIAIRKSTLNCLRNEVVAKHGDIGIGHTHVRDPIIKPSDARQRCSAAEKKVI